MGPDSKPRLVRGTMSGSGPLYKVTPVKGMPYIVNDKHVLSLKLYNEMRYRKGRSKHRIVNIPASEYVQKSKNFKVRSKGYRVGVDYPESVQPIPPYILGCWLGDGHSHKPNFTTEDPEIVQEFCNYASSLGLIVRRLEDCGNAATYSVGNGNVGGSDNQFLTALRSIGVFKNKHIPLDYKAASRNQRLEILAGLIDTDGSSNYGGFDYISKLHGLANDVAYIARSLGLAAYVSECTKICTKDNGDKVAGLYYRVSISGDCNIVPVRVLRKSAMPRGQIKDVLVTGIKVEPVGDGEFFGFEVDSDHLFLLGDFTVTHNTAWAMQEIQCALEHNFTVDAFLMESTWGQFSDRYIARNYAISTSKFKNRRFTQSDLEAIHLGMSNLSHMNNRLHLSKAEGFSASEIDAMIQQRKALTGQPCDFIVVDHLDCMNVPREKGESQFDAMKRTVLQLRSIAGREKAAMLLLSQLSVDAIKNSIGQKNKLPTIEAFRGGTPVESAKVVVILNKDKQAMLDGSPVVEQQIVICKANDGNTRAIQSLFLKPFTMHVEDNSMEVRNMHRKQLQALEFDMQYIRKDARR